MAEFDSTFEEHMTESFYGWLEPVWIGGNRSVSTYGDRWYQHNVAQNWPEEWRGYEGSVDPLEQWLYTASSREGEGYKRQNMDVQGLLSSMVLNPMGRAPDSETGVYGWGDLAYIYQMTPSGDIAQQVQQWRDTGQNMKADYLENAFANTRRTESQGLDTIRQLTSKYGHGQVDVAMNPDIVSQMLARRSTERRRPQYKGGTVTTGLLTSPALGFKRTLGG